MNLEMNLGERRKVNKSWREAKGKKTCRRISKSNKRKERIKVSFLLICQCHEK
jgi:hypothetical protein